MDCKVYMISRNKDMIRKYHAIAKEYACNILFITEKHVENLDKNIFIQTDFQEGWEKEVEKFLPNTQCFFFSLEESMLNYVHYFSRKYGTQHCDEIDIFVDKKKMKAFFMENDISTPFSQIYNYSNFHSVSLEYPLIVKPIKGVASLGVKLVNSSNELEEQVSKIAFINKLVLKDMDSEFLIEEYIGGFEYSVDLLWADKEVIQSVVCFKGEKMGPDFFDRLYYLMKDNEPIYSRLVQFSTDLNKKMGAIHGATHTEIKLFNNKLYCIETTMRTGAAGAFLGLASNNISLESLFFGCIVKDYVATHSVPNNIKDNPQHIFWYNCPFWFSLPEYELQFDRLKRQLDMDIAIVSYMETQNKNEEFSLSYSNNLLGESNSNMDMGQFVIQFNDEFIKMRVGD